jgi:Holliday junction resolvase
MIRNSSESKEHEGLVNMMVNYFNSQGFRNIKADVSGMAKPDTIYGTKKNHIPDVTAEKNGMRVILEAESSTSISDEHTASQWSLFADAANKLGGEFHVVVPKGYRDSANQRASELGIIVKTIWTPQ